jgi:hypothetical protein
LNSGNKMVSHLKFAFIVSTAVLIVGCSKARTSAASAIGTPSPAPTWPSYSALGYDKPGHPTLTSQQVKLIRKTLALLKPCRAVQLRYAFPDWRGYATSPDPKNTMVLFFDSPYPGFEPHVLWTYNGYYDRTEGLEHAVPYDTQPPPKWIGTAYEVQSEGCATP